MPPPVRSAPEAAGAGRPWRRPPRLALVVAGSAGLAALSLLLPWALAFDPQAWVVWGRDLTRLELDTGAGPSWKPLPVLLTTPFALAGEAAPALWLLVARTGGLLALAAAWALAARLGGRTAGPVAAAVVALSPWWAYNGLLGNSEGILAAALLGAAVAHLDRRPRVALALLTVGALLRPETWPFWIAYGAWMWRRDPAVRRAVAAAGVAVPLLWLGPDLLGTGGAVGASRAARGEPSPGSAGLEDVPGLAVLADAAALLTLPATLAALYATVTGTRTTRLLAAAAAAWIATVAVMAQAGYAGNPRYLVAAMAAGAVLAGIGTATLAARLPARGAGVGVGAVLVVAVGLASLADLRAQAREIGVRADRRAALPALVAAAGGREALLGCARIRTAADMRPLVAWALDVPMLDLDVPPRPPAVVLRWDPHYSGPVEPVMAPAAEGYARLARAPGWAAWGRCGDAPQAPSAD